MLRANEGDLLEVHFTNLLATVPPPIPNGQNNTSTETRYAGFHVMGLELYKDGGIGNDSSWVGTNPPVTPTSTQPGYVGLSPRMVVSPAVSALSARPRSTSTTRRLRGRTLSTASRPTRRGRTRSASFSPGCLGWSTYSRKGLSTTGARSSPTTWVRRRTTSGRKTCNRGWPGVAA